jgi:hypothetical protein
VTPDHWGWGAGGLGGWGRPGATRRRLTKEINRPAAANTAAGVVFRRKMSQERDDGMTALGSLSLKFQALAHHRFSGLIALYPVLMLLRCPAPGCEATGPFQRAASAKLMAAGVHEDWVSNAWRCSYCGCVYSNDGPAKIIRGYLDDYMHGKGWKPNAERS